MKCPKCGSYLAELIGIFWFIPVRWLSVFVCTKCDYISDWLYGLKVKE